MMLVDIPFWCTLNKDSDLLNSSVAQLVFPMPPLGGNLSYLPSSVLSLVTPSSIYIQVWFIGIQYIQW